MQEPQGCHWSPQTSAPAAGRSDREGAARHTPHLSSVPCRHEVLHAELVRSRG